MNNLPELDNSNKKPITHKAKPRTITTVRFKEVELKNRVRTGMTHADSSKKYMNTLLRSWQLNNWVWSNLVIEKSPQEWQELRL